METKRDTITVLVKLTVPPGMPTERAIAEVKRSIAFGSPVVYLVTNYIPLSDGEPTHAVCHLKAA